MDEYLRAHVAKGRSQGTEGKGLLIQDPDLRLVSWDVLALGGPHHLQVVQLIGVPRDSVAGYIDFRADDKFEVSVCGRADAAEQVCQSMPGVEALPVDWWDFNDPTI